MMKANVYSDMWLGNPPDGGAGGYGFGVGSGTGDTKVQIGTLGLTWTLSPRTVLDAVFGATQFDQSCTPPDYGTNFGTDVFGIPGTNADGRRGRRRPVLGHAGVRRQRLRALRRTRRLDPALPQRPQLQLRRQPHLHADEARAAVRRLRGQDGAQPLAAGAGVRAPRVVLLRRRRDDAGAVGLSRRVQRLRPVPARPPLVHDQVAPVRAADRPRVAVRALRPGPLAGQQGPDRQPGPALGDVPDDDPREPGHRVLRQHEQHGAAGRPRGERRDLRHRGQAPPLPAPDRDLLPPRRQQRGPRRVRHDREPDEPLAAAPRLLPADDHERVRGRHRLPARPAASRRASRSSTGRTRARASWTCRTTPTCARPTSTTSTAATSSPGTSPTSAGCRGTCRSPRPTSAP